MSEQHNRGVISKEPENIEANIISSDDIIDENVDHLLNDVHKNLPNDNNEDVLHFENIFTNLLQLKGIDSKDLEGDEGYNKKLIDGVDHIEENINNNIIVGLPPISGKLENVNIYNINNSQLLMSTSVGSPISKNYFSLFAPSENTNIIDNTVINDNASTDLNSDLNSSLHPSEVHPMNQEIINNIVGDNNAIIDILDGTLADSDVVENIMDNTINNPVANSENTNIDPGNPVNIMLCPNCPLVFNDIISLNDHILIVHDNVFEDNIYICELCESEYNSQNELTEHLKSHKRKKKVPISDVSKIIDNSLKSQIVKSRLIPISIRKECLEDEGDDIDLKGGSSTDGTRLEIKSIGEIKERERKNNQDIKIGRYLSVVGKVPQSASFSSLSSDQEDKIPSQGYDVSESNDDDDISDEENDIEIDNIPINPRGRHICPTCSRRYLTEYSLGSHFMIAHGRYDRMLELDNVVHKIGFPGLDILNQIGMVGELSGKKLKDFISKNTECLICREAYKVPKRKYIPKNIDIIEYMSDSELEKIKGYNTKLKSKKLNLKRIFCSHNDSLIYCKRIPYNCVRHELLVNCINKYRLVSRLPIIMTCCLKHLCTSCLEQTLSNSNTLSCPFCNHDHTKYDIEYIVVYEIGKLNKRAWIDWWVRDDKHIKIFLPNE